MVEEKTRGQERVGRLWPLAVAALLGFGIGQEGLGLQPLIGLAVIGLLLGYLRRVNPLLLGLSTVVLLPVKSVVEMVGDPTSHNVWPIEWIIYGLMALPGIIGACIGHLVAGPSGGRPAPPGTGG